MNHFIRIVILGLLTFSASLAWAEDEEEHISEASTEKTPQEAECFEKTEAGINEQSGDLVMGEKAQLLQSELPPPVKAALQDREEKIQFQIFETTFKTQAALNESCEGFKEYGTKLEEGIIERTDVIKAKLASMYDDLLKNGRCPLTSQGSTSKRAWNEAYKSLRRKATRPMESPKGNYLEIDGQALAEIQNMPNIRVWQEANVVKSEEELFKMQCLTPETAEKMAGELSPDGYDSKGNVRRGPAGTAWTASGLPSAAPSTKASARIDAGKEQHVPGPSVEP